MPTVIKATDRNRAIHGVAFNFEDMASRAQSYLDGVREEAKQIVARAVEEANQIRQEAQQQGVRAGMQIVDQQLDEKVARQMDAVLPALRTAIEEIQHSRQAWLTHWEQRAVHVSAAMAACVVRRELSQQPNITVALVREALELAGGGGKLRILLSPAEYEALRGEVDRLAAECARTAQTVIVPDESIEPGGCRIETEFGVIDQTFAAQLARIEEELV